ASVDGILGLADETGARVYFAHVSLPEAVAEIAAAHAAGAAVYAETCPHYLVLTQEALLADERWATSAPPVRDRASRDGLRQQLPTAISVVGSDHSTAPVADRAAFSPVHRLPGNETMIPLLLEHAADGRRTFDPLAARASAVSSARPGRRWPPRGSPCMADVLDERSISLAGAQRVLAAALALAEKMDIQVSVAVAGRAGDLKAFARMDGASMLSGET